MALFVPDGDRFLPSDEARGPWDPGALHGGPTAALVTRTVEALPAPDAGAMDVVRLSLELTRPVPVAPLRVTAELLRPGKKVQLVGVSVDADGTEVARATALRLRRAELDLPAGAAVLSPPPPVPEVSADGNGPAAPAGGWVAFHSHGVEMRPVSGGFHEVGPAQVWMRLRVPVVEGEDPSPAVRAAAVADFGNGISRVLPIDSWLFINPDLTVTLARPPEGEWVLLDAHTVLGADGTGLAESALSDERGRFGRAVQSLLIDHR